MFAQKVVATLTTPTATAGANGEAGHKSSKANGNGAAGREGGATDAKTNPKDTKKLLKTIQMKIFGNT